MTESDGLGLRGVGQTTVWKPADITVCRCRPHLTRRAGGYLPNFVGDWFIIPDRRASPPRAGSYLTGLWGRSPDRWPPIRSDRRK
jgi:hypothetical protein